MKYPHGSAGKQCRPGGRSYSTHPQFLKAFIQWHLYRYLKDDVNGLSSTLDTCFMLVIHAHLLACSSSVVCLRVHISVHKYNSLSNCLLMYHSSMLLPTACTLCLDYLSVTSYLTTVDFCASFLRQTFIMLYMVFVTVSVLFTPIV
jgi:hypothetical protein